MLIRSWNLFHGNADPPERRAFLEEMVRLATADRPDVLCLQEVPAWALARLEAWSGMTPIGHVAARACLGPLPIAPEVGHRLTELHHGLLRSAFAGQANAILVSSRLDVLLRDVLVLNSRGFRRALGRRLALDAVARLAWAKERRVCQAVRLRTSADRTIVVANLHATSFHADRRLPDAELLRAAAFADALAEPDEPVVLAGDFNVSAGLSTSLDELTGPEWGFSPPGPGIDQILVRGAEAGPLTVWAEERRHQNGRLLSDHAPVELTIQ